jgi:hypothetical protein
MQEHSPLTQMSATVAPLRRFSGRCCFQVIYFDANIFFSPAPNDTDGERVDTIWLTHAAQNARDGRRLPGLNHVPGA